MFGRWEPSGAITAPASLKQDAHLANLQDEPSPIRGDYCPGLIEAQDHLFCLRRLIAEPSGAITAPASLKHGLLTRPAPGDPAIRGDYCPGLIEAPNNILMYSILSFNHPGRLLPRPH